MTSLPDTRCTTRPLRSSVSCAGAWPWPGGPPASGAGQGDQIGQGGGRVHRRRSRGPTGSRPARRRGQRDLSPLLIAPGDEAPQGVERLDGRPAPAIDRGALPGLGVVAVAGALPGAVCDALQEALGVVLQAGDGDAQGVDLGAELPRLGVGVGGAVALAVDDRAQAPGGVVDVAHGVAAEVEGAGDAPLAVPLEADAGPVLRVIPLRSTASPWPAWSTMRSTPPPRRMVSRAPPAMVTS